MTRYEITHTIGVQHPYFDAVNVRFDLTPHGDTEQLLRKSKAFVKPQGNNRWHIIRAVDHRKPVWVGLDFSFHLSPASPNHYFVMGDGGSVAAACPANLSIHRSGGIWAVLTCPALPGGDAPCAITVQLEPACRYWEFLVFPKKKADGQAHFIVKEARDAIRFAEGEWVDVKGMDSRAWRVQTAEALPLKQVYPLRVELWEAVDGVERFCGHLAPPLPTAYSVMQPDTVSSYCYC